MEIVFRTTRRGAIEMQQELALIGFVAFVSKEPKDFIVTIELDTDAVRHYSKLEDTLARHARWGHIISPIQILEQGKELTWKAI